MALAVAFTLAILAGLMAIWLITPSWHWPAGCIVVSAGGLLFMWVSHWIAASKPGYNEGAGEVIDLAIMAVMTFSFILASAIFITGAVWWHARTNKVNWR